MRGILRVFQRLGTLIAKALRFAESRGLTDDLVDLALTHVLKASDFFQTNEHRRAYVLAALRAQGVPESVARLALEMAVALYKGKVLGQ